MQSLVNYESSEEEEDVSDPLKERASSTHSFKHVTSKAAATAKAAPKEHDVPVPSSPAASSAISVSAVAALPSSRNPTPEVTSESNGKHFTEPAHEPALGDISSVTLPPTLNLEDETTPETNPISPFSQRRQLIHSLTLPPMPNTTIPTSPPGSPPPGPSKKVTQFLELKKSGTHFNAKLASRDQLKNPALLSNLMQFAGLDNALDQYGTSLPETCKPVPEKGFPRWAYIEELRASHLKAQQKREDALRQGKGKIDFVSSGGYKPDTKILRKRGRSESPNTES